ncbi:MAG: hypothetical protein KA734_09565 [Fluviicola sp.]|nr:hypothetical protein [Fluviicola sp.]
MKKSSNSILIVLFTFLAVVFFETLFHLMISLIVQICKYQTTGLFRVNVNTGLTRFENLTLTVLSLLGLRLFFLELILKLILEFLYITTKMKLILSVILSIFYVIGFSSSFFSSFDINDITNPKRGWFLFIPVSVLLVALIRIWVERRFKLKDG